jgi:hypothetical protein
MVRKMLLVCYRTTVLSKKTKEQGVKNSDIKDSLSGYLKA